MAACGLTVVLRALTDASPPAVAAVVGVALAVAVLGPVVHARHRHVAPSAPGPEVPPVAASQA